MTLKGRILKPLKMKTFPRDKWYKDFPITSVCRADLREFFTDKQIDSLEDWEMEEIASKMGDAYCDIGFWIDLEIIAKDILDGKEVNIK